MKKRYSVIILLLSLSILCFIVYPALDDIPPINETTKTCLITGVSSGIGLELARAMMKQGWRVIGVARRGDILAELDQEFGAAFISCICDVADSVAVHAVCQDLKMRQFKPTLFFLNAGIGDIEQPFEPFLAIHKQTFATNYFGVITLVEEWLSGVKEAGGGTFVVTSSVASIFSSPVAAGYGASKAAINACFQALRLQYRNENIGFVTVLPGPVKTDMLKVKDKLPFTHTPKEEAAYIIKQVFKRKKQIEPSWFYAGLMRLLVYLPDAISAKII